MSDPRTAAIGTTRPLPPEMTDADYRLMVESVRDYAIFMLDPDGCIRSWNAGAQRLKGYEPADVTGRHFRLFYPPEQMTSGVPERMLHEALTHGRVEDEGWRLRKDGTRFWASVVVTALFDEKGVHRGYTKVTRDMSSQRRIDTLEQQERHLHQFLAMLGHELRNPLAPIANAVAIMNMGEPPNEAMRQTREILGRQVTHLCRLVDDLLDVGRIVSGKVHLDMQLVALQPVVHEAVEAHAPAIASRVHTLVLELDDTPVWVSGDRVRLVQVLSNLLHNAVKFTPDGGRITVGLRRTGDAVELSVADNGPGIAPENLQYVFKLFAQDEHNPSRVHGGLGIGLSLVHQMVHQHGGSIGAFSTGEPGRGAEFVITLPTVPPPVDAG